MIYDKINVKNYQKLGNINIGKSVLSDQILYFDKEILVYKAFLSFRRKILNINNNKSYECEGVEKIGDKYLLCSSFGSDKKIFDYSFNEIESGDSVKIVDDLVYVIKDNNIYIYNLDINFLMKVVRKNNKVHVYDKQDNLIYKHKGYADEGNLLNLNNDGSKNIYINPRDNTIIDRKNKKVLLFKNIYLVINDNKIINDGTDSFLGINSVYTKKANNFVFFCQNNFNEFTSFMNKDIAIINFECNYFEEIDEDTIIVKDKNKKYWIIDAYGLKKLDDSFDSISYVSNMIKIKKNNKNAILDNKLNKVIDYQDEVIVLNDHFFKVINTKDNYIRIYNRNNKEIFSCLKSNEKISYDAKGNILLMKKGDYSSIINDNGDIIIPTVINSINILDSKTLLIDGHLVDLNQEFLNFEYEYYLKDRCLDHDIIKVFKTNEERNSYINKLEIIKSEAYNSLNNLNLEYEEKINKVKRK